VDHPVRARLCKQGDVFLIFGATGWIGGMLCTLLEKSGKTFYRAASRIENREDCARCGLAG
jgi:hypothetical protein